MEVSLLHRTLPLAAALLAACNNTPSASSEDESSSAASATTSTTDVAPTSTEAQTLTTTSEPTAGACTEGAVRCRTLDKFEVCESGEWLTDTCPANHGCDETTNTCVACSCEPGTSQGCIDEHVADQCDCFGFVPTDCPGDDACGELDGELGCHPIVCTPGVSGCDGPGAVKVCNTAGTGFDTTACGEKEMCDELTSACMDACTVVAKQDSSVGCEFYAVDMPNIPPRNNYLYAVALSNPSTAVPATFRIYDRNADNNEQQIATGQIAPRQVEVINISGAQDGVEGFYDVDAGFLVTGLARGRAFRITSDVPIVATQFNPVGGAKAYSTDASLLLPTHTLGDSYLHMAWAVGNGAGSTMVVVATEPDTIVTVTASVSTPAGTNGMPALTAGVPKALPKLGRYDYIQLSTSGLDLTSTRVTANKEIAVFGGHSCARVPNAETGNCDHLEEQIFPTDTWGRHFIVGRAPPRASEAMTWRVLARETGTKLTFDPPVSIGASHDLGAGEFVEFTADGDFELGSNVGHPVLVAGFMHGCTSAMIGDSCPGDPSMVQVVPTEQWVRDYVFLVDRSYTKNTIKLVRKTGRTIELGCGAQPEWQPVTAGYESAVVEFAVDEDCKPGTNTATGTEPFGIMVVGEAELTSYAYPGGLQLKPINPG